MPKKRKYEENDESDEEINKSDKRAMVAEHVKNQEKRLIIILEGAQLETAKQGKSFELLNCDDHANLLRKNGRDPGSCRPDITHQCLLMLMDSPLNRAGLLQVYIHTEKNVLIEINPQTRIPRTFKRFSGLMVQLLHKFSIKAADGNLKLLKVISNPITKHLPVGAAKYGMTYKATALRKPAELVPAPNSEDDGPIVFVIGAFAHGKVLVDYTQSDVSISSYPLSAALACTKLVSAFEEKWEIL